MHTYNEILPNPFVAFLQEFIEKKGYPNWTQVTRVIEGGETPIFKQFFSNWSDADDQVGLGRTFRSNVGGFDKAKNTQRIDNKDTQNEQTERQTQIKQRHSKTK